MGMFDTVLVKDSLIENLIDPKLVPFFRGNCCDEDGYYSFQTKDLDNFLNTYIIKDDRKVYLKSYLKEEEIINEDIKFEPVTAYVHFYDCFDTETHNIFYTFKAHIVEGVVDSISVHSIEQYCLVEVNKRNEEMRRKFALRDKTWEMRLFRFLQDIEYSKFMRFFRSKYYAFREYLRKSADKKCDL